MHRRWKKGTRPAHRAQATFSSELAALVFRQCAGGDDPVGLRIATDRRRPTRLRRARGRTPAGADAEAVSSGRGPAYANVIRIPTGRSGWMQFTGRAARPS